MIKQQQLERGIPFMVTGTTGTVIIIGLAAVASLLVQSASATTDVMTGTVGGKQEASSTISTNTTNNNNNNNSNAVLGSLFLTGQDKLTSFNRINETYTKVSYEGNRTIMPPGSTTNAIINATERGNLAFNLRPNGIAIVEGKSLLMTKGKNTNSSKQENATALIVDLNGVRPNDPRTSTGVEFLAQTQLGS